MAGMAEDVRLVVLVLGEVVEAARVCEQVSDPNGVHVVAAFAKEHDRRRAQVLGDRVVERELAVLDEPQDGGGGEGLPDAGDSEGRIGGERLPGGSVGHTRGAGPGQPWRSDRHDDTRERRMRAQEVVERPLQAGR
jgi:hypothetical protein